MRLFVVILLLLVALPLLLYLGLVLYADARLGRAVDRVDRVRLKSVITGVPEESGITPVRLGGAEGERVEGLLLPPREGEGARLAILLLGGVGTGKEAVRLIDPIPGAAVLSIDYPLKEKLPGNRLLDKAASLPGLVGGAAESARASALALRYLRAREGTERVVVVGVSLGVPYAALLAARCEEVDAAALLHGGGDVSRIVARALPIPERLRGFGGDALGRLIAPLDPARFAGAISPRPLLLVNAEDDPRIPPRSIRALHDAAREPKTIVMLEGGHVLPEKRDLVRGLMKITLEWLAELHFLQRDATPPPPPAP
ncbi:MAG: alpha/beta hydrolase [Candidatus Eisenbacteria bacterium]|nr:alpha/beta hydrolase [Candidatus Eisenbacteria bacterium]